MKQVILKHTALANFRNKLAKMDSVVNLGKKDTRKMFQKEILSSHVFVNYLKLFHRLIQWCLTPQVMFL